LIGDKRFIHLSGPRTDCLQHFFLGNQTQT
jgi:hypothetical protein